MSASVPVSAPPRAEVGEPGHQRRLPGQEQGQAPRRPLRHPLEPLQSGQGTRVRQAALGWTGRTLVYTTLRVKLSF